MVSRRFPGASFDTSRILPAAAAAMLVSSGALPLGADTRQAFPSPDLAGLPYSAAVRAGNTVHVSGVLGLVTGGDGLVEGGITPEAEQVFARIDEVLAIAGSSLEQVVKCTVLLADIDDFPAMNAVFASTFPNDPPARSTIIVPAIPMGAAIEVECDAMIGAG